MKPADQWLAKAEESMKKIMKKEDNILWGRFPQKKEQVTEQEVTEKVSGDNVVSLKLPEPSRDHEPYTPYTNKEVWIGGAAVACLILVFSGATVLNIQWDQKRYSSTRNLASANQKRDADLLESLKNGKRNLSSIQSEASLLKKEKLRYQALKSYHVSFDLDGVVSEVELQAGKEPIRIDNFADFIREHSSVFPPFKDVVKYESYLESNENLQVSVYLLKEGDSQVTVRMTSDGLLMSFLLEKIE